MLVSVTGLLRQHHWLALNMAATMISTKDVGQQPSTKTLVPQYEQSNRFDGLTNPIETAVPSIDLHRAYVSILVHLVSAWCRE